MSHADLGRAGELGRAGDLGRPGDRGAQGAEDLCGNLGEPGWGGGIWWPAGAVGLGDQGETKERPDQNSEYLQA